MAWVNLIKNTLNFILIFVITSVMCACANNSVRAGSSRAFVSEPIINEGLSKARQSQITPSAAINLLMEGNNRFLTSAMLKRDLLAQEQSRGITGQFPFASVISCADSRSDPALIFDQGLADLFVTRVEGNTVNPDILGSLEYAAKITGSKAIVVLGHTHCGAVKSACDGVKMGNLTQLIGKISPAIKATSSIGGPDRSSKNYEFVDAAAEKNVEFTLKAIRNNSVILKEMENKGHIKILGAMLDIETGKVTFMGEAVAPAVKTTIKANRNNN